MDKGHYKANTQIQLKDGSVGFVVRPVERDGDKLWLEVRIPPKNATIVVDQSTVTNKM